MWFLLLYLQISSIQGLSVTLRGSGSPCTGRLEVYHSKKQWGLVCHYGWKKENGEVVCRSLMCGNHTHSGIERTLYRDPPLPPQYLMDQVNCKSTEESLWNCSYESLWDGKTTANCDGGFVAVECSGQVRLSLNLNGQRDKCAGVVEFLTPSGTIGVCNDKWDESKANKICQELGCGDHYYTPKLEMFKGQQRQQNVLLNCVGNEKYIWQCMERSNCQKRASVICTNYRRIHLRDGSNVCSGVVEEYSIKKTSQDLKQLSPDAICMQMNCGSTGNFTKANETNRVTCSGSVKLRNFKTKCFGDVSVDVNSTNYEVCYSDVDLSRKMGAVVCRELGCGEVLDVKQGSVISNNFNVECQGDERSLWHCLVNLETTACRGTKVICSGSLDVRLSDGLGRCSGRVEVQWEGTWRSAGSDWTAMNSDVVCQHLNCGESAKKTTEHPIERKQQQLELPWNVKCKSSSAKLHECFDNTPLRPSWQNEKIIEIICKKEEHIFFGDSPCKGRVHIKPFDGDTHWLPAKPEEENKKKANDTCHAMQCGSLVSFKMEQNTTHANVTCSGSVSVVLRNQLAQKCWGTVVVCGDGKCGGVCRNTWRPDEHSKMVCKNLGCGDPIQGQLTHQNNNPPVKYYSVYCSEKVQSMSMCNFIPNKDFICNIPAQVICTDSVKAKLEDLRDKCAGKASLFYAGKWTPICQDNLDTNLKNAICKELFCGESINGEHDWTSHEESEILGLSGITCLDSANSVSKCNLNKVSEKRCTVGYMKCTGWERLLLYKEDECSGPVYGLSGLSKERTPQPIREQGWGREEGQKLCEYLQCGNYSSHSTLHIPINTTEWWSKTYNCAGKENMWECERHDQSVQLQQLNIKCDRKPPNIMLTNNCTGDVLIDNDPVCASQWDELMSNKLCDSLNCGKALHWDKVSAEKNCWHFSCTGMETSVWQCGSKKGSCKNILSVACTESVEFSSTEKCGGKLGIRYKGKWEYVCGELNEADVKKVCDELKCNNSQKLLGEQEIAKEIEVTFSCPEKYYKISQCVQIKEDKCTLGPAEITCPGYIRVRDNPSVSLILGLLGGMLGLLILFLMWTNRKRLLLAFRHYRNRNGKDINTDVNEMDKMDTEDGDLSKGKASFFNDDYEDVDSLMDGSGEEDEDDRKRGSSGTEYDDIEGQSSGISPSQTHHDNDLNLPLLPKRPKNILDQDTYEVELEKQEDYDDVTPVETAANENAGTQARVDVDVDEGADSDSEAGPGASADAALATTEVEVHAQRE